MKSMQKLRLAVLSLGLAVAATAPAQAADDQGTVRPEVGRPLQAAQELIKQQKYRDALSKVTEAEKIGGLTALETNLAAQLRGSAAQGAGDYLTAAKAFEAVVASGKLAAADQLRLTQAVGSLYYQAKDYPKAIAWVSRYLKDGGTDGQSRALLAQAYYLSDDFASAAKETQELIRAEEHAGQPVPEYQLQVLLNSQLKQDDTNGYGATLEKLVAHYPKTEYWAELLRHVSTRTGFSSRLALDSSRLSLATGTLGSTAQYVEFAELALQAGLPGEAKTVLDKGYATGLLGSGADAERHKRLRDLAAKNAAEDLKTLPGGEVEAAAQKEGTGLVNTGFGYVGHGQTQKGIALIEQGLQKGGLKRIDEAKLHLGIAYLTAGQKDKAVESFKTVQGSDGTADLARLWVLQAKRT